MSLRAWDSLTIIKITLFRRWVLLSKSYFLHQGFWHLNWVAAQQLLNFRRNIWSIEEEWQYSAGISGYHPSIFSLTWRVRQDEYSERIPTLTVVSISLIAREAVTLVAPYVVGAVCKYITGPEIVNIFNNEKYFWNI